MAGALKVTRQAAWHRYKEMAEPTEGAGVRAGYLTADEIWTTLVNGMQAGRWYELSELYDLVLPKCSLSEADQDADAPGASSPKWRRNVRNVLQRRKTT